MGLFSRVPLAPADPILGLTQDFLNDPRENKINLGVGLFKDEELKTPILQSVKLAEEQLLACEKSKQYLPIGGDQTFFQALGRLVFGENLWSSSEGRIAAFQALGGTGALKIGAAFLKEEVGSSIWISSPSWPNHRGVLSGAGFEVHEYLYYDHKEHRVNFSHVLKTLEALPPASIVVLHACCHNPTGTDLSVEEWKEVCSVFKNKQLIPFFDMAYQGLGEGFDEDAFAPRYFLEQGLEMLCAISNSKNLSLYAERVGALFVVSSSKKEKECIESRVKQIIRAIYSNPPLHGAKAAALVLTEPKLRELFEKEVGAMRARIQQMRALLVEYLKKEGLGQRFSHLERGKGMFGFLGLSEPQVLSLRDQYGIYMPHDGRVNVCGLTKQNISRVTEAIQSILQA